MPKLNKCKTNTHLYELLVCVPLCITVVHNTAQNSSHIVPLILQIIIIGQMMSTGGEGLLCLNSLFATNLSDLLRRRTSLK